MRSRWYLADRRQKGKSKHMKISLVKVMAVAALGSLSSVISGQNLAGTVVADDTGEPLAGATVVAVQRAAAPAYSPSIYKAIADTTGRYAVTVSPGQYTLCVHGGGLYLDPCQWGGASVSSVAAGAASVPLRVKKGAWFIIRIHDQGGLLPATETVPRAGVAAYLSAAGVKQFLLPVVYDNGRIRDYGAVVPINLPLTAVVSSSSVLLTDENGAAPSATGTPLQVAQPDPTVPSWFPPSLASMFPRPTAKVVHFYTTGRQ
jgi:hypothetical protein